MFQSSLKKVDFATKKSILQITTNGEKHSEQVFMVCPATIGPSITELLNLKAQGTFQNRST